MPVGDPRGDTCNDHRGDHAQDGKASPVDRDSGYQLDGEQEREGWPAGDGLADRVVVGVQHVRRDGGGDADEEGGADGPAC